MGLPLKQIAEPESGRRTFSLKAVNACAAENAETSKNRAGALQENFGAYNTSNWMNKEPVLYYRKRAAFKENGPGEGKSGMGKKKYFRKRQARPKVSPETQPSLKQKRKEEKLRKLEEEVFAETEEASCSSVRDSGAAGFMDAVLLSCVTRARAEVYWTATGKHLAEVEKVLEAVSPRFRVPFCRDERRMRCRCSRFARGFPLRVVWEWYDQPSSCGVEVKGCRDGASLFNAYFAPSLSAIQLFKRKGKGSSNQDLETCYEFFESEKPHIRLPLLQMIRSLASSSSDACLGNGASSFLEHALHTDFHPLSWFAVAWYPIYKIPEGDFRAAFLTYHTLGHMCIGEDGRTASLPVVGLRTYQCKREQWLESLSQESRLTGEMLRQRVIKLQKAAETLSVSKCSQEVHRDFDFFSRFGSF